MSDDRRVSFLGLGNMGVPMASRLTQAGFTVTAFDPVGQARSRAEAAGVSVAADPVAAASGADVLILMLPDSRVVTSVLSDSALLAALAPDTLVIDMSSSEPMATRALAAQLSEHGVRMIDAPVSGGVSGARKGALTIMVGGAKDDVDSARPVFEPLGRAVHVGEIGAGDAVKALNNLMSATSLWITGEAMAAGERFGIDPQVMLSVFNTSSGRSGSTENKWPNFVLTEAFNSGFGLRLMLKDMRIGVSLAETLGVPHDLASRAVTVWADAADKLPATADHTEVAKLIRPDDGESAAAAS